MSHIIPAPGTGPWRILVLDRDPHDPKWIMCTVATPADVQPALIGPGGEPADLIKASGPPDQRAAGAGLDLVHLVVDQRGQPGGRLAPASSGAP
jgi:hypothetical protein